MYLPCCLPSSLRWWHVSGDRLKSLKQHKPVTIDVATRRVTAVTWRCSSQHLVLCLCQRDRIFCWSVSPAALNVFNLWLALILYDVCQQLYSDNQLVAGEIWEFSTNCKHVCCTLLSVLNEALSCRSSRIDGPLVYTKTHWWISDISCPILILHLPRFGVENSP